jgi:hypothetical protein
MILPVFQLTWSLVGDKFGLVFPSELDYETQTFVYALPVPVDFNNGRPDYSQIDSGLASNEYYLPCEIDGHYVELEGKLSYPVGGERPIVQFNYQNQVEIDFEVDLYRVRTFYRKEGVSTRYIDQYVGTHRYDRLRNFVYIILEPTDITGMNTLFNKKQVIIVGYTPFFGSLRQEY